MERAGSMMSDSSDDTDYVPAIVCPICSTPFDTELEAMTHVSVCIENESMRHDEDFARSFVSSGGADADAGASYSDHSSWRDADVPPAPSPMVDRDDYGSDSGEELVDDDSFPCPLCEKLFPVSKIEAHASRCMGGDALAAPLDEPPIARFSPSPAAPAAPAAPASKPAEPAEVPEGHKSCPYCEKNFPEAEFDEHVQGHQPVTCPKCHKDFEMRLLADHEPVCIGPTSSCPFCNRDVRDAIFDEHVIDCQERANAEQRNILRESQEREALSSLRKFQFDEEELNERQHRALDYVVGYSSRLAAKSRQSLLKKFEKNGWNKETLSRVLIFIRDRAPIIIHIHPNVLNFLNKDRFYKNQFETGTSSGTLDRSVRTNWENRLFNKIYNDAKDKERVKYGVLNIVCDIRGVKPCLHYGDSYILLKSEIRYRCTFSSKDSGYEDVYPSTVEYYEHVLNEFADAELREVVDVACGKKDAGDSSKISQYKELQIHGPVRLDQDVEALVMNVRHQHSPDILALATEFAERNRCNLLWCADP